MSECSKNVRATISRNNSLMEFCYEQIKRGDAKGTEYLCPSRKFFLEHLDTVIKWLTAEEVAAMVHSKFKQWAQGIYADIIEIREDQTILDANGKPKIDTDGNMVTVEVVTGYRDWTPELEAKWTKAWIDLSVRGEGVPELKAQREGLMDEMCSLDNADPENVNTVRGIIAELQRLTVAINAKSKPRRQQVQPLVVANA